MYKIICLLCSFLCSTIVRDLTFTINMRSTDDSHRITSFRSADELKAIFRDYNRLHLNMHDRFDSLQRQQNLNTHDRFDSLQQQIIKNVGTLYQDYDKYESNMKTIYNIRHDQLFPEVTPEESRNERDLSWQLARHQIYNHIQLERHKCREGIWEAYNQEKELMQMQIVQYFKQHGYVEIIYRS